MQFNPGDIVMCSASENRCEVQFGPFTTTSGNESYLIKWLEGAGEGRSSLTWASDLLPAPRFVVGQKVAFSFSSAQDVFELVAGPFPGDSGPLWVMKSMEDGMHDTSWEAHLVPVVK